MTEITIPKIKDYPHGITKHSLEVLEGIIQESYQYLNWGIRTSFIDSKLQLCQEKLERAVEDMKWK